MTPVKRTSIFPIPRPPKVPVQPETPWDEHMIDNFSGGLNTADPAASLRKDQFTSLLNYYTLPNGHLKTRNRFKPYLVSAQDTVLPDSAPPLSFTWIELGGTDYLVACWDNGANTEVSVWDASNNRWAGDGGGTSIKSDLTDGFKAKFVKFSVNDTDDLIFCNGKDVPQRWIGTVDTASSDLGLAVPPDGGVHNVLADPDNSLGEGVVAAATHASADGGASTILTFASTVTDIVVGEHVEFTGVTSSAAATWNVSGGVVSTAIVGSTITFAISYSSGTNFTAADITHDHWVLTTAATGSANERGITINGTYYYRFTDFYDSSGTDTKYGETGKNDINSSIAVAASEAAPYEVSINTFDIPAEVSHINIYRSPPNQAIGPFKYVGRIDTENVAFIDNIANGAEGIEAPLDAGTPPRLKNPLEHKGKLWGVGINSSGVLDNKGVWSNDGQPDFFAATSFAYFEHELAGPVAFRKDVYWFTAQQIFVTPEGDVDTYPKPLKVCDIGCDSFDSIVDVGNGLVWQYEGNIYWANFNDFNPVTGDLPFPIGEPVRDKIDNVTATSRSNSNAVFHSNKYIISFSQTGTTNVTTLTWNVQIGTLLLRSGLYGSWSQLSWSGNDLQSFKGTLYSADNINKYVQQHDITGVVDYHTKTEFDAATTHAIETELSTGRLHLGQEWSEKIVNSISVAAKTSGTTLTANLDCGATFNKSSTLVLGSATAVAGGAKYGSGIYGTSTYAAGPTLAFYSAHKKFPRGAKNRNFLLSLTTPVAQDTELLIIKLYYKPLPVVA